MTTDAEKKEEETKDSGKKYEGGPIPKVSKKDAEKLASSDK